MVGCRFPLAMWNSPLPSLLRDLAKGEKSARGEETLVWSPMYFVHLEGF